MENKKQRILIMTCSHGSGHRMVAQTLKDKYIQKGCEVLVFDIFNEYNRFLNLFMEKLYLLSYKPLIDRIYGFLYYSTEKRTETIVDNGFYVLFSDIVNNVVSGFKPDLIVNTYNHRTVNLNKDKYFPDIPLVSVVTEFTLPNFWIHKSNDKYYIASEATKDKLLKAEIPEESIVVSGIPVREIFNKKITKEELLDKYNLSKDKKTLVIFAGTFGVLKDIRKICDGIEKIPGLQTIVVCGLNKKLYKKLQKQNYENISIMRYVNDINEIYEVGDFMVTKPGGTVLSEVTRTHLPVILYDPVPGQEKENALIFANLQAGLIAENVEEVLSKIILLKENDQVREKMEQSLKKLNKGDAAEIIVNDSLNLLK